MLRLLVDNMVQHELLVDSNSYHIEHHPEGDQVLSIGSHWSCLGQDLIVVEGVLVAEECRA